MSALITRYFGGERNAKPGRYEWPVVVSPEGTAPRQHSDALVQSRAVKFLGLYRNAVCFAILVNLRVEYDYVWFVPSGAVKDDLRHATLVALPVPGHGAVEPIE
ncbi:hypothetical protein ACVXHB_08585 [Escherichia coli]